MSTRVSNLRRLQKRAAETSAVKRWSCSSTTNSSSNQHATLLGSASKSRHLSLSNRRPLHQAEACLTAIPVGEWQATTASSASSTSSSQADSSHFWTHFSSHGSRSSPIFASFNDPRRSGIPSPYEDLSALWSAWMAKVPKGFENFFPRHGDKDSPPPSEGGADGGTQAPGSASAGTGNPKKVDPKHAAFKTKDGGGGGNQSNQGGKKNRGTPPPPDESDPQNIPAAIALLLMVMAARRFLTDGGEEGGAGGRNGREITFVDFRNHLLDTGKVEKIVVVNNQVARVVLHPGSAGIPSGRAGLEVSVDVPHDGEPDKTILEFSRATNASSGSAPSEASVLTDSGMGPPSQAGGSGSGRGSPVYHFNIGSVESFEEKLSKAQANIHPREWVPVQYVNEVNLAVEFVKATPMLVLIAILYYYSRGLMGGGMGAGSGGGGAGGGMGGIFQVGKSNAKKINPESVKVSFKDVAGCQQAKQEVMEFVQFLSSPEQFTRLGAKIPKGALLCGPPGTGKTLLAKAVAGEAGVPFYSISGSDFIEMFVGVGPSRVRDLFKEARNNAPCIIFIDEIDAVGRQRGRGGFSGGNDERENTLNQLLVEMDGFNPTAGVVVLAGTNRVDILDQALTRPGRFDRQITVDRPDLQGRREIFNVHLDGITLQGDKEDYAGRLAGLTPGFAGADIANLCNEAAIVAARRKGESVTVEDFEKATDRIIGGLESNKIMGEHEKRIVAYHEAGHAVAGWFLEHADPLMKVTIIPRSSGALGFAQYLPKEVYLRTQEQIMDIVCKTLAGRAAEDVVFGRVTTGASDDLKRVTQIVYSTIQMYGMNSRVGQLAYPRNDDGMPGDKPYSESTAEAMDDEARAIVDAAYIRTVDLIREHRADLEKVAQLLLEKETITHDDMVDLIGARPFAADAQYQEYVSNRAQMKNAKTELAEDVAGPSTPQDKGVDTPDNQDGLTPGLA